MWKSQKELYGLANDKQYSDYHKAKENSNGLYFVLYTHLWTYVLPGLHARAFYV